MPSSYSRSRPHSNASSTIPRASFLNKPKVSLPPPPKQTSLRTSTGEEGGEAPLDVDDVVAYAHKVSCTTSAPPNWNPNMPLRVFLPPAPNEALFVQGNYFHNTTSAPIPGEPCHFPAACRLCHCAQAVD